AEAEGREDRSVAHQDGAHLDAVVVLGMDDHGIHVGGGRRRRGAGAAGGGGGRSPPGGAVWGAAPAALAPAQPRSMSGATPSRAMPTSWTRTDSVTLWRPSSAM